MAIFVTLLTIVLAYVGQQYWRTTVNQSRDDRARLVGTMLGAINDATKTYTTTYFAEIQEGQSVTRNGYTLPAARLLTPTTTDLNGLGFLASKDVNPVVYNGQSVGFTIQIAVDTSSGCTIPTCNLPFQITTTTPLTDPSTNAVDIRRSTIAANTASPGNAGVSMPTSFGGNPNIFVTQNGTQTGTNPGGTAGLISISNGYDASGFMAFARRDGTLPMTGDINMQDDAGVEHNIDHAGTVNANNTVTGTLDVTGLAVEGNSCSQLGLIAANSEGKLLSCNGTVWGKATDMPSATRITYTSATCPTPCSWTVPAGVKSAMVTMAGGGGSGVGWRFAGQYIAGHSGGFVFSYPVNLVAGETMTIVVGKGAAGAGPTQTQQPVTVSSYPYYVFAAPSNDDGTAGYPGTASMLIAPDTTEGNNGVLLECDGGSGATFGGIDNYNGPPVPGPLGSGQPMGAAVATSGFPKFPEPWSSRQASGPYTYPNSPGGCTGGNIGNQGAEGYSSYGSATLASGYIPGALTPFGYGSGGGMSIFGCYVSPTEMGTCVTAGPGRDGVVMIDLLY
ncbi:hypothetical protein [Trinickia dinghuensis]|nr:hypothetical protein [Trinickia dinghuensis]